MQEKIGDRVKLLRSYRFWAGIGILALLIVLRYSRIGSYVTLAGLQEQRHYLEMFVDKHYVLSALIFMILYALVVIIALPLPALFTLTGGFLFGTVLGTLYSSIGATVGALLFFILIRHSLGASIQKRYKNQLARFNARVKKYGTSYIIAIRFIAFIPFFIQNIMIGLTKISLLKYSWTTIVGIVPGSFVYAYAGQQLAEIGSIKDVFSGSILIAFILLALLGLVPIVIQQHLNNDQAA